jgi:hypothetical protein
MESAVNSIFETVDKSFEFVNLEYDPKEIEAVKSLNLNSETEFDYFGVLESDKLFTMIKEFIINLGNSEEIAVTITNGLINKIISPFLKTVGHNSMWFTIRIQQPTVKFNINRWNSDGYFYKANEFREKDLYQLKLAGTFTGEGTLFKKDSVVMRNKYLKLRKKLYSDLTFGYYGSEKDLQNRKVIMEKLQKFETVAPSFGQVSIFVVGSHKKVAIHSEPSINKKRFFFSIVPGDCDDIKELATRRNKTFTE